MSLEVIDEAPDRGMIAGAEFDAECVRRFETAFAAALNACTKQPERKWKTPAMAGVLLLFFCLNKE